MTTTRRLSSLQGQGSSSHQQTSLLLDSYETFKRKHIQQNKEIIAKNSELNKEKADLQSQLALMRVERLSLMGSNLNLNIQLESLRKKLERALDRERSLAEQNERLKRQRAAAVDPEQFEAMRHALVGAIAALQAFDLALPPTGAHDPLGSSLRKSTSYHNESSSVHLPSSPPASPPRDHFSLPEASSSSRRSSLAERGPRQSICVSPPDLSNISEADASDEERQELYMREEEERRVQGRSYTEPILSQLSSSHQAPTSEPEAVASTSAPAPEPNPAPLARPPSRGPRAPPKAPSAASHSALGNASGSKRPVRRVSGMLRPSVAVEFGENDGGVEEEEAAAGVRNDDMPAGLDSGDEPESTPVARAPTAPAAGVTSRSRRRVSSIGLDTATAPSLAVRTRVSRSTSPAMEGETVALSAAAPAVEASARPALREIQPAAAAAPAAPTPTAKEKIVERMRRRTTRVATEEADVGIAPPAVAAVLASFSRAKAGRTGGAGKDGDEEEEDGIEEGMAAGQELDVGDEAAPTAQVERIATETVAGSSKTRVAKEVAELKPLAEDTAAEAAEGSEDAPTGGRRARKSVNYALPKLNTKMRRPEDYVPVKPGASKPRKSSRPTSTVPRTSDLPPMSLESTPSTVPALEPSPAPPAATPVPRPASLAGKKPPLSSSASAVSSTSRDDWNKEQFLRQSAAKGRATGAPAASLGAGQGPPLSTSQAGQDLEARRRQRQAARDQLARLGGGSGGAGEGSGA